MQAKQYWNEADFLYASVSAPGCMRHLRISPPQRIEKVRQGKLEQLQTIA